MNILITGGAGFIGGHLAEYFTKRGDVVTIFDNFSRNTIKWLESEVRNKIFVHEGSILDMGEMFRVFDEPIFDVVIHCAGVTGIDTVVKDVQWTLRTNILGIKNVIDCIKFKYPGFGDEPNYGPHVIVFSSGEVYGLNTDSVIDGNITIPLYDDRWSYALSKIVSEYFIKTSGLRYTVVRPFNVYGPRQVGSGAIKTFIRNCLDKQPVMIHNPGSQIRSWCYIDDFVDGISLVVYNPDKSIGKTFDIGNDTTAISVKELAVIIHGMTHSEADIMSVDGKYRDVQKRVPNIDAIKELGYSPKVMLRNGIKRTIDWYKSCENSGN